MTQVTYPAACFQVEDIEKPVQSSKRFAMSHSDRIHVYRIQSLPELEIWSSYLNRRA
jgi:hypothetical protein